MPFREVDGADAGADAIGILVPPGRRTVVVVRPRSLELDMLLVRRGADGQPLAAFHEASAGEALMLARNLGRAFGDSSRVEVVPAGDGSCWIHAAVGAFLLIVCARVPGQPYRPLTFLDEAAAQATAHAVQALLCPPPNSLRELYFNTTHFAR